MSAPPRQPDPPVVAALPLSAGRLVRVHPGPDERVEVIGIDGQIEVSIALTAEGPVLRLSGARLELSADTMSFKGRRVHVEATEQVTVASGGELVMQSPLIRLN